MHQAQKRRKSRLSGGEFLVALISLAVAVYSAWTAWMLVGLGGYVYLRLTILADLGVALGAGVGAGLTVRRLRRLAASALGFAAFAVLLGIALMVVTMLPTGFPSLDTLLLLYAPQVGLLLLLAWFAWFLERLSRAE